MFRWNSVFVCLIALTVARANGNSTFSKDVKPLLQRYCVNCHGPKKVKAELRIDQLNPDLVKGHDAEH